MRFWAGIPRGLSSEEAAAEAGASVPVGVRWIREGEGMSSVTLAPLPGRCLSFVEREEVAILRACGCGVRETARRLGRAPSTILRELRRGGGRSPSSTRPTASFAATYRSASPAPSSDSTGRPSQGRGSSGTAGVAAAARTVARRGRRVPSRSPTGGVWTTGTIRRCASRKDWTSICYQVHKTVSRGPDELKKCPRSASIVASGRTVF